MKDTQAEVLQVPLAKELLMFASLQRLRQSLESLPLYATSGGVDIFLTPVSKVHLLF